MRKYESSRNWTAGCAERCLSGAGWSWWETHCRKTEMGALLRSAFWSVQLAKQSILRPRVAVPCEEGDASGLGVFSGTVGLHHGGLQCARPVAWLTAHRVGLRTSLHS